MYRKAICIFVTGIFLLLAAVEGQAQLRDHQVTEYDYTGSILKQDHTSDNVGLLSGLFDGVQMEMDHSYSMNFTSLGGQYQNINMYTNTMHFGFTDDLSGRLDISMMHSPFGGSFNQGLYGHGGPDARIMIRNAELNYDLGPNSQIQLQFRQSPSPFTGYGTGFGGYYGRDVDPFFLR
jgi:hypothetical protein